MPRRALSATAGDRVYQVDVGPDGQITVTASTGEAPLEAIVHYLGHGRSTVDANGRRRLAHVVDDGTTRWVWVDGHVFEVAVEARDTARRRSRGPGADRLAAPMPATVVTVPAVAGMRVARGDTLVVLEAMKMELPLRAPHAGVVRAVHCTEGELVQPGVTLVDLEAAEDAP
jgi:3-methylcrotonyl-CoA carboxylase alpha subunit